jgi:DNA-binding NtrC family response regulator
VLEVELFGDPKDQGGYQIFAEGGTLFLADVDGLPGNLQVKLLTMLQEGASSGPGWERSGRRGVRLIAATTCDLAEDVASGRFSRDLYHRLNACPIHVPPLREHREDVPALAQHFLEQAGRNLGKTVTGIERDTLSLLTRFSWPGNVVQLRSSIEQAVLGVKGTWLRPADLPGELLGEPRVEPGGVEAAVATVAAALFRRPPPQGVYRAILERVENVLVEQALRKSGGVRLHAARLLGVNRNTLYAMIERTRSS